MAVNLLLVGRNGNGKFSIGNTILGAQFFKPNSYSQSSIDNISSANNTFDGKMITVVDGPFIKDTNMDDPDDINLALECAEKAMELCPEGFDGVVIILKYGVRFTQQEKYAISLIRAMFGVNVFKDHGICAFSYGDTFALDEYEDGVSFESWCMKQTGDVAELFKECNNRCVIFNNRDDGSKRFQRDTLLSYVDRLHGKRYTFNEYQQAKTGRKGLVVIGKRSRLEEETRKILGDISVALGQIDIHGNPDYSRIQILALKKKLEKHKEHLLQKADGTQLLDYIFNNIKVTEMTLDTKLKVADVVSQMRYHEQAQRPFQDEENTPYLLDSTRGLSASTPDRRDSIMPKNFLSASTPDRRESIIWKNFLSRFRPWFERFVLPLLSNSDASMSNLREQEESVDMTAYEAKSRIADELWFHGILPREEVERLLVKDGDFLVRESKNKKTSEPQFVLSVFWEIHIHFIIQFLPDKGWFFEGDSYPTIKELLRQQYKSERPVTLKSGVILKTPVFREWKLLNDDIELKLRIGSGNFGEVFKGVYKKTLEVAVKTCKDTLTEEQKIKFLQEGRIMRQYNHPNIVKFIGIAAQKQPVMIVMEFIPKGALLSYLNERGASHSVKEKVQMCVDAASGMEYLEEKSCIHRDLAARNCLVGENNVIKISDFGMSRVEQVYSMTSANNPVPLRWTAPEALKFSKYTSLCDVWSFGVLTWEIFSNGKMPYLGMTNMEAIRWIEEGNRMAAPPGTPAAVYSLMLECWEYLDNNRPHFSTICKTLKNIAKTL